MRAYPRYVVDASVVASWFSGSEENPDKSEKLLTGHVEGTSPLASCSLVLYEVCNTLRFNPGFGEQDLLKAAKSLLKLGLELVDFPEVSESAITIAFSQGITIYDAAYIAVSQTYHIPLITADYKLLAKIKDIPLVMPLKEIKL
ncbi:MAG: type II toxin-antitoxin system VapC family toxin [Dehalococcoidia bacterium]